ncbi:hypothetical protein WN943_013531 [Citrus x changshan-huyou]
MEMEAWVPNQKDGGGCLPLGYDITNLFVPRLQMLSPPGKFLQMCLNIFSALYPSLSIHGFSQDRPVFMSFPVYAYLHRSFCPH